MSWCYKPDSSHTLQPVPDEEPVVAKIFRAYTRNRLGSKTIARNLNHDGHRTTLDGPWSGHQVLRILSNRVYLGEFTFRDIVTTGCHTPLVDQDTFDEAQRILTERGDDHTRRRANASDYTLTGRMRCPNCDTAMIGTRAHSKTKVYRYYTCHNRNRYDASRCDSPRLNADATETAVLTALVSFYRDHHQLIADVVTAAQREHNAGRATEETELAAVTKKLTDTAAKIDRYLTAFENGTLDEDTIGSRVSELRATQRQLTARRDELAATLDTPPTGPDPALLTGLADAITAIIDHGTIRPAKP